MIFIRSRIAAVKLRKEESLIEQAQLLNWILYGYKF